MIKKEKFKLVWQSPPLFAMHVPCINYENFNFKKEQAVLIPEKYNDTCIRKMLSVAFQTIF